MCLCPCVCIYVCVYMCACLHTRMCVYVYECYLNTAMWRELTPHSSTKGSGSAGGGSDYFHFPSSGWICPLWVKGISKYKQQTHPGTLPGTVHLNTQLPQILYLMRQPLKIFLKTIVKNQLRIHTFTKLDFFFMTTSFLQAPRKNI